MTGILDRIKNTTVSDLEGVRSDFDDLPRGHFRAAVDRGMVRIVKGADDLTPPARIRRRSGGVVIPPVVDSVTGDDGSWEDHNGDTCNNPKCCPTTGPIDHRSPGQRDYMDKLISWIAEHDADVATIARTWTDGMTERGLWVAGKDTNTSDWINRLRAKLVDVKAAAKATPIAPKAAGFDPYDDIPTGYYALVEDAEADIIKFYRVKHHAATGRLYVDACASDARHPVRVWATRKAILDGIRAMGWEASTALYGSKIGHCGRCHRELTDADSRARGIGPDCRGKM